MKNPTEIKGGDCCDTEIERDMLQEAIARDKRINAVLEIISRKTGFRQQADENSLEALERYAQWVKQENLWS
jgi:hypothetical protein